MRRTRGPRVSAPVFGGIFLAIVVLVTYVAFTKVNPFHNPFEMKAAFRTANDIKKGAPVRIAGVNVGKVTNVEGSDEQGAAATVTMEIEDNGLPIHEDATMKIRPRIFLEGNYFVDLKPGSPSAPTLDEGDTIPATQTAAPVQIGQVLTALQSDTRQDLQIALQEFGRGITSENYAGARGFNDSIPWWAPAYRNSAIANTAIRGLRPGDLTGYIRNSARVAAALTRNRTALKSLITDFATFAGALADESDSLRAGIAALPPFLRQGNETFDALNTAFPPLRELIVDLRPAVRSQLPAIRAQLPFVRQSRLLFSEAELQGLVRDLRPTIPDLVELNRGGVPFQRELRELGSCNNNVVIPNLNSTLPDPNFPAQGPVYQEAVKWLPGIAGESRSFDANGQFIKTLAQQANYAYLLNNGRFYLTSIPLQGVNPPKQENHTPMRPDVPCETQEPPNLATQVQAPPEGFRIIPNLPDIPIIGGRAEPGGDLSDADRDSRGRPQTTNRLEIITQRAIAFMREELERQGRDDEVEVRDEPLRPSELDDLDNAPPAPSRIHGEADAR